MFASLLIRKRLPSRDCGVCSQAKSGGSSSRSPSRRHMGTPTGRLATIPSATGAAAKQAYNDDDDNDVDTPPADKLSTAHEDDGTPRHSSNSPTHHGPRRSQPVTVEDVE